MQEFASQFRLTIHNAAEELSRLAAQRAAIRPQRDRWSPCEILGHLIDSAANNHGRFIEAQLRDDLVFPGYDQEAWVKLQRYREAAWADLITLWRAYNLHLAGVFAAIPAGQAERRRSPHSLDCIAWRAVDAQEPATLEYLIRDYYGHMQHHLRQISEIASVPIEVTTWKTDYREAFKSLNLAWIERYFSVEEPDRRILQNPQGEVIDRGGEILFITENGLPIATCCLLVCGPGVFELAKMAVTESAQGRGIGNLLMRAALQTAAARGAGRILLHTDSRLTPALELYRKFGFRESPQALTDEYERGDMQLEYSFSQQEQAK